jgi:phosphopantetheinyl transferase
LFSKRQIPLSGGWVRREVSHAEGWLSKAAGVGMAVQMTRAKLQPHASAKACRELDVKRWRLARR